MCLDDNLYNMPSCSLTVGLDHNLDFKNDFDQIDQQHNNENKLGLFKTDILKEDDKKFILQTQRGFSKISNKQKIV